PIETGVYTKGEPALHAYMQLPKLGMQIVMVKVRTLASLQHQFALFSVMIPSYRVAQARLDGRKDRDQSFFDFMPLRQFTSQILLADPRITQVLQGPSDQRRCPVGCRFNLGGRTFSKSLKIFELYSAIAQITVHHRGLIEHPKRCSKPNPIKAAQNGRDVLSKFAIETLWNAVWSWCGLVLH